MVESPFDLFKIKMEMIFRDSTVMIQPMFGIRPKTLNPIDVVTSSGSAEFFLDDDMIPTNGKKGVSMPIIGIIQASRLRMGGHQRDQFLLPSAGDREGKHYSISLQDTKNHLLTSSSPASFSSSFAAKHGFIHFDLSGKLCEFFKLNIIDDFPEDLKPSLDCLSVQRHLKSETIGRDTKTEEFDETPFPVRRYSGLLPKN